MLTCWSQINLTPSGTPQPVSRTRLKNLAQFSIKDPQVSQKIPSYSHKITVNLKKSQIPYALRRSNLLFVSHHLALLNRFQEHANVSQVPQLCFQRINFTTKADNLINGDPGSHPRPLPSVWQVDGSVYLQPYLGKIVARDIMLTLIPKRKKLCCSPWEKREREKKKLIACKI